MIRRGPLCNKKMLSSELKRERGEEEEVRNFYQQTDYLLLRWSINAETGCVSQHQTFCRYLTDVQRKVNAEIRGLNV